MKWLSPETLYQTPRMPGSLQQPVNLPLTRRNESGQIENYGELETAAVESRDQDREVQEEAESEMSLRDQENLKQWFEGLEEMGEQETPCMLWEPANQNSGTQNERAG